MNGHDSKANFQHFNNFDYRKMYALVKTKILKKSTDVSKLFAVLITLLQKINKSLY